MNKASPTRQREQGLTLIELLIVVAIIGILAVLLLPTALTAIQKTKQKATMKEIMTLATATADYITDKGAAPTAGGGNIDATYIALLVPFYVKAFSSVDQWNSPYQVYTGTDVAGAWGLPSTGIGVDDFLIGSYGRGGTEEFSYSSTDPGAGLFIVDSMADFASDLVTWNAKWISAPSSGGK